MGNSVMLNGVEYAGEQIAYKDSTYELVSKVAYLIGVPLRIFQNEHEPPKIEIYNRLEQDKNARIIRNLWEPLNNSLCSVPTRCISRNLPLVKMISAQNSHYLSAFLLLFLKKGRLPPVSGYGEFSPGHGKRIQIGTSEHGVQSVLVFLQTTIHGFPVAELTLDDPERVLYFAAHR